MLNSHQRCSNSSIFCINAKTCTTRNLHEVLQARTYQRNICENFAWFLYYPCSHRTLFWSSGWCHWRQWPDISAEREPVGHPWQFKVKKMKDMRERNFLILIYWIMEGWCLINKLAPSVIYHHFSSNFILHSQKVSYIIRIDKRKFFGAGWPTQLEFPTGGKARDPRKAADPVTGTSQNSGTDSKVWMREEHE